ncbi:Alpha/Beta hydrolase protein [Piptocephalis cylindrospora]|uniref:Alpha/Beta hydrolase protein n=1 Tax=Piptocephalis cylindrospora TaxID=1907219 RepID=A0A4P9Y2J7_9FUNG|nr:Alpha/Beta hydrolase protein [Piptocephalis cylindrospora]|eukprot:RKP13055.1 Alpha/Beta hydrolase protein [Piptocephalis cylindrospora]
MFSSLLSIVKPPPVQLSHHGAKNPLIVSHEPTSPRDGTPSTIEESWIDYLTPRCPSLWDPKHTFHPTPFLFSGHLQTFFASKTQWEDRYQVLYERDILHPEDGGTISLDWTPTLPSSPSNTLAPDAPCLVVLHGLTGGSHEAYVRSLLEALTIHRSGYRAVVVNFRGCANTPVTSPQLYNGGYTKDFRLALARIQTLIPNAPLGAVGFSLGSNLLVKYLGEEGKEAPFRFAMSVGNPFDLFVGSLALKRGFIGRHIYQPVMAGMLKRLFLQHQEMLQRIPGIDVDHLHQSTSVREFDDRCTRVAFQYDTVDDYYRDASSSRYITRVRVPLLCLNSLDDPISCAEGIPWDECRANPYILLALTQQGGHLGWFEGAWKIQRWCTRPLAEFAHAMFQTQGKAHPERPLTLHITRGGQPA